MSRFARARRVLLAVAILGCVCCFALRLPVLGQVADARLSKLTALLAERRDVLKSRVDSLEVLFRAARIAPDSLLDARSDLLEAEYELAKDKAQRIRVLNQKLANAREFEALMKQRKAEARGTEADVLLATARRLEVEIRLVREAEPR